jgi:glucose/arabinose dehydrogenase
MHRRPSGMIALSSILALAATLSACTAEEPTLGERLEPITLPSDFIDQQVANVPSPTALAFTPDGRLLITTQPGKIRVYKNGSLLGTAAIDLAAQICTNSERGVLGIAVDPNFASNSYVYVFYTKKKYNSCANNNPGTSPVNRVSRFTYNTGSDTISLSSELVLIDNILSLGGNHNGGDLHFGNDGLLYVSVGDSGCELDDSGACGGGNENAKFASTLSGKILRIAKDGSIPSDNPNAGNSAAVRCGDPAVNAPNYSLNNSVPCKETFASGLRNPFRFGFKPGTNTFHINDVGQNKWEEIDLGVKGANYGWNTREGNCANNSTTNCGAPPAGMTNPIHAYGRGEGCVSITGGAFVPSGAFGSAFNTDTYLFGDYGCGKIFKLTKSGSTYTASTFATNMGGSSVVGMTFGPSSAASGKSLYYTTYAEGGKIRRIDFTGQVNRPPTAIIAASPTSGPTPLTVSFNGSGSSDPDGNSISYAWTFGDGQTQNTSGATVNHVYSNAGSYTAKLVVTDSLGLASDPATIVIQPGNTAPTVSITAPSASTEFAVGQSYTFQATANDAQDGPLSGSSVVWTVTKHHLEHTHPFLTATGTSAQLVGPEPEDLAATTTTYLEVQVTATDSQGLSTTTSRDFYPNEVALTFNTAPSGRQLILNNTVTVTAPTTVTSWKGWPLRVSAPSQSDGSGTTWAFASWSDGGAATHDIVTPSNPASYTATFTQSQLLTAKVNFQPDGVAVPAGYVKDVGLVYGPRGNGLTYGWNAANDANTRDRDSSASPDQRYDTLTHLQKPNNPNATWEIAVPNGVYDLHLVAGDASNFDSVFRLRAEGTLVLSGTPTTSSRWVEANATVTVSDGKLTISNGTGAANNKICFIEIEPH